MKFLTTKCLKPSSVLVILTSSLITNIGKRFTPKNVCLWVTVSVTKSFKCLSDGDRIYVSASVWFDENDFPCKYNPKVSEKYDKENIVTLPEVSQTLSMFLP